MFRQDISDGVGSRLQAGGPECNSGQGKKCFSSMFSIMFLGPNHSPSKWKHGTVPPEVKRQGYDDDDLHIVPR
jgi:hypothetical protein